MRLGSKNLHYRSWKWKENELTINDNITGSYKEAIGRFFLHPLISILNDSKRNTYLFMLPNKKIITFNVIHGVSKLEKTKFSAEFGKQEVTHLLKVYAVNNQIMVKINW